MIPAGSTPGPSPPLAEALVSVVIPAYNPGSYLSEAVESALEQTHPAVEVVVVDDGSSEDLAAVCAGYAGVRCVRQSNRGVAAARNRGAEESVGDFLVFLDADDRLLPDAVRLGLGALRCRPEAAFASGLCMVIDAAGQPAPFTQQPPLASDAYTEMLRANFIWMPAEVIYRRRAFLASGGFDSSVDAAADYDLYLRITRTTPIACHRSLVAEYRNHGVNMSRDPALMLASTLRALRRQWPHVRRDPARREAYRAGRRFWQEWYGERVVAEVRANLRADRLQQYRAVQQAVTLLRHHPAAAFRELRRKLRCMVLDRTGTR